MKITYDRKADAMNIKFQDGKYEVSKELAEGIIVDYTKAGKMLRIEILDASKRVSKKSLQEIGAGVAAAAR